jgi:hypothetical protein
MMVPAALVHGGAEGVDGALTRMSLNGNLKNMPASGGICSGFARSVTP